MFCFRLFTPSGSAVLLYLFLLALCLAMYVVWRKRQKDFNLRSSSAPKLLGLNAALIAVIIVFNWTNSHSTIVVSDNLGSWDGQFEDEIVHVQTASIRLPPPKLASEQIKISDLAIPELPTMPVEAPINAPTGPKGSTTGKKGLLPPLPPPPPAPIRKAQSEIELEKEYDFAEEMPYLLSDKCPDSGDYISQKNCADQQLLKELAQQTLYPRLARQENLEAIVYFQFTITPAGKMVNLKLLRIKGEANKGFEQAARKSLERLAKKFSWQAGKQAGQKVAVRLVVPIKFKLNS